MPKPKNLIDRRTANTLISDAEAKGFTSRAMGVSGQMSMKVVEKMIGGVWIGGTAWLTTDALIFEAGRASIASGLKIDDVRITLPLNEIEEVSWRKAFLTSIIDISAGEQALTLRCYKAQAFADRIRSEAEAAALKVEVADGRAIRD